LLAAGLTPKAIKHRITRGRLRPVAFGVYAVGRPFLTQHGRWMAAVLTCGDGAALSHTDAGALFGFRQTSGRIEVTAPTLRRRPGLVVHRGERLEADVTRHQGIPVTSPIRTLVDLASQIDRGELEAAVNEADKLDLVSTDELRAALDEIPRRPGVAVLRSVLDRQTFRLTDSELERLFLKIVYEAGLPSPETGTWLSGFRVDFYWPDLGLVVETDGLRYHRTPVQQAKDLRREQVHTAAGRTTLRFPHAQVKFEGDDVRATLTDVAEHLRDA
jgi:very-short-patch-repair endonuclease